MSDGLKDILSNLNKDIEQEKLLQYLNQHMSEQEKHAFESQMNDDEFMNDAVEGLQSLKDKNDIPLVVNQLNTSLKKQLTKKKRRTSIIDAGQQTWVYFSIILILLLIIAAFLIIRKIL